MGKIAFDHRLSHGAESSGIESLLHDGGGSGKNGFYSKPRAATRQRLRSIPTKSMRDALFDDSQNAMHAASPFGFSCHVWHKTVDTRTPFYNWGLTNAAVKSAAAQRRGSRRFKLPRLAPITNR
ncbi:hypothetical protein [Paraburkholderia kirstenboschensis]|uniref:hypothetical protein n=1 Tax=Paraburkholderia kirstenboschensis TaxID=1245436 RepID=UPI000FFC4958|nr:hypothetical protein [Paraburkholderia kirstenboschensis]